MSRRDDEVELHGEIGHETAKAIQFTPADGEPCWLPLSQVNAIHRAEGRIVVTRWIAREKDLL